MRGVVLVAFALCGCGDKRGATPDAEVVDSPTETPVDTAVLPPDSSPDSMPDAATPSLCTAPATLVDVSPRRIANFVRSGSTLYTSVFAFDGVNATDAAVLAVDTATGAIAPSPLLTSTPAAVFAVGDDVLVVEFLGGTISRIHPGDPPTVLITNRLKPRAATADAEFLYWSEENPAGPADFVRRRLLAGGPIEDVMTCENSFRLLLVGPELYCAGRRLQHAPKAGGQTTQVTNPIEGFFIPTLIEDAGTIYFANSEANHSTLFEVGAGDIAVKLHQLTGFGRPTGIVAAPAFIYMVDEDSGLWRVDRTTHVAEHLINTVSLGGTPVRFNGEFYLQASTPTSSGEPLIVHCLE
jgi:hypothetical protein